MTMSADEKTSAELLATAQAHPAYCTTYDTGTCNCRVEVEIARKFHVLAVKERDFERHRNTTLCADLAQAQAEIARMISTGDALGALADRMEKERNAALAEIERLKAALDEEQNRREEAAAWFDVAMDYARERNTARAEVEQLREALAWYVEHDETNESPENTLWLEGKRRAMKLLGKSL